MPRKNKEFNRIILVTKYYRVPDYYGFGETVPGDTPERLVFQEDTIPGLFRISEILVGIRNITGLLRFRGDCSRGHPTEVGMLEYEVLPEYIVSIIPCDLIKQVHQQTKKAGRHIAADSSESGNSRYHRSGERKSSRQHICASRQ